MRIFVFGGVCIRRHTPNNSSKSVFGTSCVHKHTKIKASTIAIIDGGSIPRYIELCAWGVTLIAAEVPQATRLCGAFVDNYTPHTTGALLDAPTAQGRRHRERMDDSASIVRHPWPHRAQHHIWQSLDRCTLNMSANKYNSAASRVRAGADKIAPLPAQEF